jgi:hypothetical protein
LLQASDCFRQLARRGRRLFAVVRLARRAMRRAAGLCGRAAALLTVTAVRVALGYSPALPFRHTIPLPPPAELDALQESRLGFDVAEMLEDSADCPTCERSGWDCTCTCGLPIQCIKLTTPMQERDTDNYNLRKRDHAEHVYAWDDNRYAVARHEQRMAELCTQAHHAVRACRARRAEQAAREQAEIPASARRPRKPRAVKQNASAKLSKRRKAGKDRSAQFQAAVDAMVQGATVRAAAKQAGLPESTLRAHLKAQSV